MNTTLKLVIGVVAALAVGLLVGYVVGSLGKGEAQQALEKAKKRAKEAEAAYKEESESCAKKLTEARSSKRLLLAKEQILRSIVEHSTSNYGLASKHLAQARRHLKASLDGLSKKQKETVEDLYERIGKAQTLTMRFDPMARVMLEKILRELTKLPGGH
jgi:uncharacterized membrane-anchored protein YhcB (DUF1043 family)